MSVRSEWALRAEIVPCRLTGHLVEGTGLGFGPQLGGHVRAGDVQSVKAEVTAAGPGKSGDALRRELCAAVC